MIDSRWAVQDERAASRWLKIPMATLKRLRIKGGGPRFYTLPTGHIGYFAEDLYDWVLSRSQDQELSVEGGGAQVIAFPGSGIKIKRKMPKLKKKGHQRGPRSKYRWGDRA